MLLLWYKPFHKLKGRIGGKKNEVGGKIVVWTNTSKWYMAFLAVLSKWKILPISFKLCHIPQTSLTKAGR